MLLGLEGVLKVKTQQYTMDVLKTLATNWSDAIEDEIVLVLALGTAPNPHQSNRQQLTDIIDVCIRAFRGSKESVLILAIDEQYSDKSVFDTTLKQLDAHMETTYGDEGSVNVFVPEGTSLSIYSASSGGGAVDIVFVPFHIPTAYFQDLTEEERLDRVNASGGLKEFASGCKPADTDPWTTVRMLFARPEVKRIVLHNSAWWRLGGSNRYSNLSLDSMCELLYLLYESGKWTRVLLTQRPNEPDAKPYPGLPVLEFKPPAQLFQTQIDVRTLSKPGSARRRTRRRRMLKNPKTLKKRIR